MKRLQQKELVILVFCILAGFALRFYTFDERSLWIDEIHTLNDSKDNLKAQIAYYKENPTFLHPPLFFILTHLFHPFAEPERDLRVLPLIFGILSIPMIYLLSRQFSPPIAVLCTLSLTFMAYHVSLSQDGRAYSLVMFLAMVALYFFVKHLRTSKRWYLPLTALVFAVLLHTSYTSVAFIALSQMFWFYRVSNEKNSIQFSNVLLLNGLTLLLCAPWILFLLLNYKGQVTTELTFVQDFSPLRSILLGILNDWLSNKPLAIISILLLILFPFLSKPRKNALLILAFLIFPTTGMHLLREISGFRHFIASRYFICFFPLFLLAIFLSLDLIESRFVRLRKFIRLKLLFTVFLVASNFIILPAYYNSEKQDFRGLVNYLNPRLKNGDKIFVRSIDYVPGLLHYFKVNPRFRHHDFPYFWNHYTKEIEFVIPLPLPDKTCTIHFSNSCCAQYVGDRGRLWIIVDKHWMGVLRDNSPCVFMGSFDGSFANFDRFPTDASMYLFLWDPKSPGEKGIDMKIE